MYWKYHTNYYKVNRNFSFYLLFIFLKKYEITNQTNLFVLLEIQKLLIIIN